MGFTEFEQGLLEASASLAKVTFKRIFVKYSGILWLSTLLPFRLELTKMVSSF